MAAKRIGRFAFYAGMQSRGYNGINPTWLGFSYGLLVAKAPRWSLSRLHLLRHLLAVLPRQRLQGSTTMTDELWTRRHAMLVDQVRVVATALLEHMGNPSAFCIPWGVGGYIAGGSPEQIAGLLASAQEKEG